MDKLVGDHLFTDHKEMIDFVTELTANNDMPKQKATN